MSKPFIILSAQGYDFTDKETGRKVQGISLITVDDFVDDGERGHFGYTVAKITAPIDCQLPSVPGLYEPTYQERNTSKGVVLKLVGLKFVKPVDLFAIDKLDK